MEALKTETATLATSHSADLGFTVPRKEIAKVLATMARIADRKSSIAILANVAIRAYDDGIVLCATDLNVWATYHGPREWGSGLGGTTVNAKSLADIVKKLSGDEVSLSRSGVGLRIASAGVDTTLIGGHDRDFPKIPTTDADRYTACDGDALGSLLERALHSVCQDETRFHLNGVFLEATDDGFRVVSTDGHRLTLAQCASGSDLRLPAGIIIPAKAAKELAKLLKSEKGEPCAIAKHQTTLFVKRGGWELAIKLIDAQFPPYVQVIPKDHNKLVTIERKPLIEALKRAKALTCSTRGVRLDLAAGKLTLTSDHPDTGTASESLKAESQWCERGGTFRIGVNPSYLLESISEIDCKHVTLVVGAELDPILVRSTDDAVSTNVLGSSYLAVVMPMRI